MFDNLPRRLRCHARQLLELCGRGLVDVQWPLPCKPFGDTTRNRASVALRRRRRIRRMPLQRVGIVRGAPGHKQRQRQEQRRHANDLNHRYEMQQESAEGRPSPRIHRAYVANR